MTIRRIPEDFRVIEVLTPQAQARIGPRDALSAWAVYEVTKTSLTTPEAAQRVAKLVECAWGKIGWAGLKDKHGVTTQVMSVPMGGRAALPETLQAAGITGQLLGWSSEEPSSKWIARNQFQIVVRDLSRPAAQEMAARLNQLTGADLSVWITNYFGEQRFSSARHGKGFAGACLIRGDFEGALRLMIGTPARKDSGKRHAFTRATAELWGRWSELLEVFPRCAERGAVEALAAGKGFIEAFAALPYLDQQMAVEAYQSHLWNRVAAMMTRDLADSIGAGVIAAPDAYGEIAFAMAPAMLQAREWSVPLPAHDVDVNRLTVPVRAAMEAALVAEGVSMRDLHMKELRRPAFTTADRPLMCQVHQAELSPIEKDELTAGGKRCKRTLCCQLGPGSYATVVLRALGQ
jgi:tRNA pseudouridine13 synthase